MKRHVYVKNAKWLIVKNLGTGEVVLRHKNYSVGYQMPDWDLYWKGVETWSSEVKETKWEEAIKKAVELAMMLTIVNDL